MNIDDNKARITPRSKDLLAALQREFGEGFTPGTVLEAPMPAHCALAAAGVRSLFGKEVVIFRNLRPDLFDLHGAVVPGQPSQVFLNEDSDLPPLAVVGHELVHSLRRDAGQLFTDFLLAVGDKIPQAARDAYGQRFNIEGDRSDAANVAVYEEMLADFVGDRFVTAEFWQAVGEHCGGTARSICSRLAGVVRETPANPLRSDESFTDHTHVEGVAVAVMGVYSEWIRHAGSDERGTLNGVAGAKFIDHAAGPVVEHRAVEHAVAARERIPEPPQTTTRPTDAVPTTGMRP